MFVKLCNMNWKKQEVKNMKSLTLDANSPLNDIKEPALLYLKDKVIGRFFPALTEDGEMPDDVWGEAAKIAEAEGYIGVEETKKLFERIRNAKS
jgi:hypothetical protein